MSSTKLQNRVNFGKTKNLAEAPDLLEVQIQSFKEFFQLETTPDKRNIEGMFKVFKENIEPNQNHIQADYVVIADRLDFTARVGGRSNSKTKLAVLRGYVSEGPAWLIGAGVHDEFENYLRADGTLCSKGTLEITLRWK